MDYMLTGKLFADLLSVLIFLANSSWDLLKTTKKTSICKTSEQVYPWQEKHSMDIILAMDPDGDLLQLSNQKDFYVALR